MKSLLLSLAVFAAAALPAFSQVPVKVGDVKLEKILPSPQKTPEYSVAGYQKRSRSAEWLEVEVEFTTVPEMIDELTFVYKVLVGGKLLVGEVTHVNIPKGKEHYSVAYISPRTLESLLNGKAFTGSAVQGLWVDVTHQGQVLGTLAAVRGAAVPNVAQVKDAILNKSQTPFAPLVWDRYEALKPSAGR